MHSAETEAIDFRKLPVAIRREAYGIGDAILPTGAKLYQRYDGRLAIHGYAFDGRDVTPYLRKTAKGFKSGGHVYWAGKRGTANV